MSSGKSFSGGSASDGDKKSFEDTVKNLLKMPHKPHKPAKAEEDRDDNVRGERAEKKPRPEAN